MLPWAGAQWPDKNIEQWDAFWWDGVAQFYPWRLQLHRALQRGEWPLWDNAQFCGYPLVANGQSALFYPLNWLYGFLHPGVGMGISSMLHFILAALLMFGFCREMRMSVAAACYTAIAFTLGAFMVGMVPLPTLMNSIAWLPGALWGVEIVLRRRPIRGMMLLGLSVGMAFLAGHLQIALYVWLSTAIYALARARGAERRGEDPRLAYLIGGAVIGIVLSAPQFLPSFEMALHSPRGHVAVTDKGFHLSAAWGLKPVELVRLLWPDALGSRYRHDYQSISYGERCGYVGLLTALLALCALGLGRCRGRWGFGLAAALLVWGAMGGIPAMVLYFVVPKQALGAGFVRLLSVYGFCIAVLGGMGLDVFRRMAREANQPRLARLISGAALAILCLDLVTWGWRTIPSGPASRLYAETELTKFVQSSLVPGERVLEVTRRDAWRACLTRRPHAILPPNSATAYEGIESVQGYDSLYPQSARRFAAWIEGRNPSPRSNGNMLLLENTDSPLLDLAGVRLVLTDPEEDQPADTTQIEGVAVLRRPRAFPRAFLIDGIEGEGKEAISNLASRDPRSLGRVWLQGAEGCNTAGLDVPARSAPKTLVVTNTYYPGWRGWAAGQTLAVHGVGGIFQGALLPAGPKLRVLLTYAPATVHVGLFLLCVACGTLVLLLVFDSLGPRTPTNGVGPAEAGQDEIAR